MPVEREGDVSALGVVVGFDEDFSRFWEFSGLCPNSFKSPSSDVSSFNIGVSEEFTLEYEREFVLEFSTESSRGTCGIGNVKI